MACNLTMGFAFHPEATDGGQGEVTELRPHFRKTVQAASGSLERLPHSGTEVVAHDVRDPEQGAGQNLVLNSWWDWGRRG